jgi:hypothetical protein
VFRKSWDSLRAFATGEYVLIVILGGAFFSYFALNRGATVVFIELSGLFLLFNFLSGQYRIKEIPLGFWIGAVICAYIIVLSVIVSPQDAHYRWIRNLLRMQVAVLAILCLAAKQLNSPLRVICAVVLGASLCWQSAAYYLWHRPYGTFSNLHYLGGFTAMALPMLGYFYLTTPGRYRYGFIPIAIMALDLLLKSGSRPALLGLVVGVFFALGFLVRGRWKWFGLAGVGVVSAVLYLTRYAGVAAHVKELIVDLPKEERVQFWTETWNRLRANSLQDWVFGHGIGWLPVTFSPDGNQAQQQFVFPHLHFLEVLYLNGAIGAIGLFGGLALLFAATVRTAVRSPDKSTRLLAGGLVVVFLAWFVHCSLVYPIYSRSTLYPFAFIFGSVLAVLNRRK